MLHELNISLLFYFVAIMIWVLVTYKIGDWRNWKVYYPTILFFCCGNLIGFLVFNSCHFWQFRSTILSHATIDILQMTFIFTCTTIIFLQYYPNGIFKQVFYILLWVIAYTSIEWFFNRIGGIVYSHGWNIWLSFAHNIYQFILLKIHLHNPVLAWILSFIILGLFMSVFKVNI